MLGTDTAAVLLLDEATQELVARAAHGLEEEVEQGVRIPVGRGFAGRMAAERRPIFIPDVDHSEVLNPILREKGVKSLLGAPLLTGDRVLGVIHVGTLTPRRFTREETELLELAAGRAALGIERALAQEDLLRLNRLKRDFIALAAHELRAPASVIHGIAATLHAREADLDATQTADLKRGMYEQTIRLNRLIDQLLDLSRLEAGAVHVRSERFALRPEIERIVQEAAGERHDDVVVEDLDFEVHASREAMEHILTNLVTNALTYGQAPVTVGGFERDRHFYVTVTDSGRGVAPEFVSHLFEPFQRSESSRGTRGTGLGLAISRSYAQAHGGELIYEQAEPTGARFRLVLPRR
jgi:signal transduction histidine kinase